MMVGRQKKSRDGGNAAMQQASLAMVLPMMMLAGPLVGYFLGHWIGQKFGHEDIGRFVGLALGIMAGARESWHILKRLMASVED